MQAYRYATLALFAGMLFMWLLDKSVHVFMDARKMAALNPFKPVYMVSAPGRNPSGG